MIRFLLFIERIRRDGSYLFWPESVRRLLFVSNSWHCLVDRACGDTSGYALDGAGRLTGRTREQTELLLCTT